MHNEIRSHIQYSKAGGHYFPAFFKMGILNGADLTKINEWDRITSALFFHEYIHFLQDISTVYGLNNIIRIGEIIHEAIGGIKKTQASFEVPYPFSDGNIDTRDISIVLTGFTGEITETLIIEDILVIEKFPVNTSNRYYVPKVIITYNGGNEIIFGSHAIAEGMAYIAEQSIAENDLPAASYPYRTVGAIADFICPGFSSNILNVYVLCDLSLMHSEPGAAFLKYLRRISSENATFSEPEDIYGFFSDEYFTVMDHMDEFKDKKVNRTELFLHLANFSMVYISGYFQHIPGHPNIAYLKRQLEVTTGYRLEDPAFMVKIIKEKGLHDNKAFSKLVWLLGSPFLVDLNGKSSFMQPQGFEVQAEMEMPWMMTQFLADISVESSCCKALAFCRYNEDSLYNIIITDGDCYENPWRRAQKDQICPYGRLLSLWGIRNKDRQIEKS